MIWMGLWKLTAALGKAEVIFQNVAFSPLACFRFFAVSCPGRVVDTVLRCGRSVDASLQVLAVEKRGSFVVLWNYVLLARSYKFCPLLSWLFWLMMTFQLYHYLYEFYSALYHLCHFLQFQCGFG